MLALRRRPAALIPALTLALSGVAVVVAGPAGAAAPTNDDLASATTVTAGTKVSSTTVDSTLEEPETSGVAQPDCGYIDNSVWFQWTAPPLSAGTAAVETSGSTPLDSVVQVWSGTSATYPLTAVGCDDQSGDGDFSLATFVVSPGTTYYIQVGNYVEDGIATPPGPFDITLNAPANDNLAAATTVPNAPSTTYSVSNVSATKEPGETGQPTPSTCANFKASLWYKATPTVTGPFTVTTIQTSVSVDTQVQVWTGPASSPAYPLTAVLCNDDIANDNLFSKATFSATAGQTYYVQISSYGSGSNTTGSFDLKFEPPQPVPPDNDLFASAASLTLPQTATVDVTVASLEGGEPVPSLDGCEQVERTAWYAYTPAATTGVTLDTLQTASGDSVLAVYSGPTGATAFDQLTPVACNDDAQPGLYRSKVSFLAASGATYYLQVGTYSTTGNGSFTVNLQPYAATPTETALAPVVTGRQVDLTANVTPFDEADPLTGTVQFLDGATVIDSVPLSATGTAATTVAAATPGHHDYAAVFISSDWRDGGSTSSSSGVDIVVDTTTTLTGNVSGRTVTLTSAVAGPSGTTPVGSVRFFHGETLLGEVAVSSGTATKTLTDVPVGTRTYRAVYQPTSGSGYNGSSSNDVTVTVSAAAPPAKVSSTTTIKAPKDVKSGKAPKITITVKRGSAGATGQVTIKIGSAVFKTVTLGAGGVVKVKLPKLTKKAKVTATYAGNATTLASSAKATIKIRKKK